MESVNISLFIHSCVLYSTSVADYTDSVCHQAAIGLRTLRFLRDAERVE